MPEYKKELEARYPLMCKRCAPIVQGKINRADYYGMTRNAAKLVASTKKRGGRGAYRTRDDWWKKFMRNFLRLVGSVLYVGLFAQVAFHIFGILSTLQASTDVEPEFADEGHLYLTPTLPECAQQVMRLTFDTPCYNYFSALIPRALALAASFVWYNPGIKAWYHHTRRIEAVHGQNNYFFMQLIIFAIRSMAWYSVSDLSYLAKLDKQQIIAIHGFAILFMLMTQAVANRSIKLQNWTIKGQIMPKPEEKDILSESAADLEEHFTSKPTSKDPWKYLRREEKPPLDLKEMLAKKDATPALRPPTGLYQPPPSPEFSDYDDEDVMETDDRPVMRSSQRLIQQRPRLEPTHTYMNHSNAPPLGFSDIRNRLSGIEHDMRLEEQRRQQEQQQQLQYHPVQHKSPFYGKLPPAPMSMERRLRNPVLRPAEPQKVPLSQQPDFMAQMRRGVKPVKFPEKGSNFELKKSDWVLPSDKKELGLEERFLNTFSLKDESPMAKKSGLFGFW